MRKRVDISLIIATRGNTKKISKLVNNLHGLGINSYEGVEIILVDNNDPFQGEIKKLCVNHDMIYLHEPKKGKSYAVNTGIINSRGKYIAFTDDGIEIRDKNWLFKLRDHFLKDSSLGYVSGKVLASSSLSKSEVLWEKKGGLSKGDSFKYWNQSYLSRFRFHFIPWQFNKICAGANSMIPRHVFEEIGGFNILLDSGTDIGAGGTIEIGYRIAKRKYALLYDPSIIVFHEHPKSTHEIKKKLFVYGRGDTAYQMLNFLENHDFRCLFWALFGHPIYTLNKMRLSILCKYPLKTSLLYHGFRGNMVGSIIMVKIYYFKGGRTLMKKYNNFFSHRINE